MSNDLFANLKQTAADQAGTPADQALAAPVLNPNMAVLNEQAPLSGAPDELETLKNRANIMGLKYSNNIKIEALRAKIADALAGQKSEDPVVEAQEVTVEPEMPIRQRVYLEQMRLVRCRITNLNPNKKELPGEIFAVGNDYVGTVKKYIPYGEQTDNGYHIPYILYVNLVDRTFPSIRVRKNDKGQEIVETRDAREFAIEVLPPLTQQELDQLRAAQAARGEQHD